jgi:hypothetical protein
MWKDSVKFQTLTVVASASITTSYVAAVTVSLPVVMMGIKNGTNGDIVLGIDGTTAKWGFPASSGGAYDVTTNSPTHNQLMLSEGTTVYIKWQGSAPGSPTGNVYIEFMEVTT